MVEASIEARVGGKMVGNEIGSPSRDGGREITRVTHVTEAGEYRAVYPESDLKLMTLPDNFLKFPRCLF